MLDPMYLAAAAVGIAVGLALAIQLRGERKRAARHARIDERNRERGGAPEPASLHPRIDEHQCICTGACVTACPEKDVLGMVDGRPRLLNPAACVGHGECLRACPVDAVTLIVGSEKRGVDLPMLSADFQTSVPGVYIAGELGGMGLIHNAVNQGVQAMRAIAASLAAERARGAPPSGDAGGGPLLDAVIVGAGPAGLAAALCARERGLQVAVLDQEAAGGAVRSFPRQKIVMTYPVSLPLYGPVKLRRTTKEALLELWEEVIGKTGVVVESGVKVEAVRPQPDGTFVVEAAGGARRARRVLLAIGRRGTPRKLGVPGEVLAKVTYRLLEPEQYRGQRCVVFGGGDAAVESALMLAREPGTEVTLVHRGERFDRLKPDNQAALDEAEAARRLRVVRAGRAVEITEGDVAIDVGGVGERIGNDFVFVFIGGELPTAWLGRIGIEVRTLRGEALPGVRA